MCAVGAVHAGCLPFHKWCVGFEDGQKRAGGSDTPVPASSTSSQHPPPAELCNLHPCHLSSNRSRSAVLQRQGHISAPSQAPSTSSTAACISCCRADERDHAAALGGVVGGADVLQRIPLPRLAVVLLHRWNRRHMSGGQARHARSSVQTAPHQWLRASRDKQAALGSQHLWLCLEAQHVVPPQRRLVHALEALHICNGGPVAGCLASATHAPVSIDPASSAKC